MRHSNGNRPRIGKALPLACILTPTLAACLFAWFAPADLIPLPQTTRVCTAASGGTLRLHTTD